jgi:tetratricopeptide (TPR) repeat protein
MRPSDQAWYVHVAGGLLNIKAMKKIDKSIEELIALAEQEVYAGNFHQAIKLLQNALYDEPGYAKLHYTLGWVFNYYLEDTISAVRHYRMAVYFDCTYKSAYIELAEILFEERRMKEVKNLMAKAKRVQGLDKTFIYATLGKVAEQQQSFAEALGCYRRAVVNCMDNDRLMELKQTIKRTKLKRFKKAWGMWQPVG